VQIVDWDRGGDVPLLTTRIGTDDTYTGCFSAENFRSSNGEVQGPGLIVGVFNGQGCCWLHPPRGSAGYWLSLLPKLDKIQP